MNIPRPDPEVYREAARLLSGYDGGRSKGGVWFYSCVAIRAVCSRRRYSFSVTDMYLAQYSVMMRSNFYSTNLHVRGDEKKYSVNTEVYEQYLSWPYREPPHPFWNHPDTPATRAYRTTALLLMADIVENP